MQEETQVLLESDNLTLRLDGKTILEGVSLQVKAGQIVTLIGPNGAGKSCLLKCLLGLETRYEGRIHKHADLSIGYTPQAIHFDATLPLTVEQFLALGRGQSCDEYLAEVKAQGLKHKLMYKLSGGELQRVLLARALSANPQLLVLDEPAQGVDITGQAEVYKLLAHIAKTRGCGVLLVSHDLNLVMAETSHVICLNRHVCCHGHPESVTKNPEFQKMFGSQALGLALYTHHHDHTHSIDEGGKDD